MPAQAISDNSVADEMISLNVTDKPLGEVLENLSIAANCQFSIDESWEDYPITASFENEPLYRGLKLILRNINNAVIYGTDRTVNIIVYDSGASTGKTAGQSVANRSQQDLILQPPTSGDATAPQPEVDISEENRDMEDGEQQLEEAAESAAETNETDAENIKNIETNEGEPEEENHSTEETESAPGGLEDSES
jgi:hypothetical protein